MTYKSIFLILIVGLICFTCSSPKNAAEDGDLLPADSLHPLGRYAWNDKHHLELISSAVHFGFRFSGKECKVVAYLTDPDAHSYLQYEVDGAYQERIRISGNSRQPIIITAAAGGVHSVWIYKATEAHT